MPIRPFAASLILWLAGSMQALGEAPVAPAPAVTAATPAGTTFTAPADWATRVQGQVVTVGPPEADLTIDLTDVAAKDAATAVAAGLTLIDPSFKRPVRVTSPAGPRDGWEERSFVEYEVSPNEKLAVTAYAFRAGDRWLVGLFRSSEASAEKRGGEVRLIVGSLRPKGYVRETFAGRPAHPIDAAITATLRQFVAGGMKDLQIPGVAFSLIDGGRVVFEGGVGVRELGRRQPIDRDTLFIAASNTKALTTLLLAQLVDEKKLRWEQPVTEVYPAFRLGDDATTRKVLIKHLVCACTGMPRQDLEWLFQPAHETPLDAMRRLGAMQPTSEFGAAFQYSNSMAAAAGFIGGAVANPGRELGSAYDDAMQTRILTPLGMTRTTFDFRRAMQGNFARPHDVDIDGRLSIGSMALNYTVVPLRPAGGIWTSAHDLSQYVMLELAHGALPDGRRLVSAENLLERRKANVIVGADVVYGMALMVDTRYGVTVVHHGGDLAGYHSDMLWLPDYNVGAVILTNSDTGRALRGPFLRRLVELLFDGKPEADAQLKAAATDLEQTRRTERARLVAPADPAATRSLAARYRNATLGDVAVTHRGRRVWLALGTLHSEVATRRNDDGTTSLVTISPTLQGIEFVIGQDRGKRSLVIRDAQHEYLFVEP